MSGGVLSDVRVLDFGQIYNGSYCGLLLSYLGAEVISVEPPQGDPLRHRVDCDDPAELVMLNSSKDAVSLDLKSENGRVVLFEMVQDADVLVENFGVGTMDGLGVGYDRLKQENKGLIYAHSTGFGETGPRREQLAMDLIIQATAGVMDITGEPDGTPMKTGAAIGDFLGGTHLLSGVLAALYHRERTGEGSYVEVSMQDAVYPTLLSQLAARERDADVPPRTGNRHTASAKAPYNAYEAADGYAVIICATDTHWERLTTVMGKPSLAEESQFEDNASRVSNIDTVDSHVQAWVAGQQTEQVIETCREAGIPCGAVQSVDEVMADEHLVERGMIQEIYHPVQGEIRVPGLPIRLSTMEQPSAEPASEHGADTEHVLTEKFGMDAETVESLVTDGVVSDGTKL